MVVPRLSCARPSLTSTSSRSAVPGPPLEAPHDTRSSAMLGACTGHGSRRCVDTGSQVEGVGTVR